MCSPSSAASSLCGGSGRTSTSCASARTIPGTRASSISFVKRGSDPFKPHDLDFFLAFPTREAADAVAAQMTTEGFKTDVIDTPDSGELRFSLHAQKSLHLTVPDMQDLSRRLTDMAIAKGGRYDGWSAKQVPIADSPIH
jgi:hypothetical protein